METMISTQHELNDQEAFGFVGEELTALERSTRQVLKPPYQGIFLRKQFDPRLFSSADRQYKQTGQIVAQLWTEQSVPSFGIIQSGLRREFTATCAGTHRIGVTIDAGPITRIQGASTFVRAFIPGLGGVYGNVSSHQSTQIGFSAELDKDVRYNIFVVGGVVISNRQGPPSYGEVIATFPSITVFPAAVQLTQDSLDARLGEALARHDSPQSAARSLSEKLEEHHVIEMD